MPRHVRAAPYDTDVPSPWLSKPILAGNPLDPITGSIGIYREEVSEQSIQSIQPNVIQGTWYFGRISHCCF